MRISDWSSDVCSSDLPIARAQRAALARDRIVQPNAEALDLVIQLHLDAIAGRALRRAEPVDQGLAHQPAGAVLDRRDVHVAECGRDRAGTAARIDGAELATRTRAEGGKGKERSEEHTYELQSLMRISYAVFCLKKKKTTKCTT